MGNNNNLQIILIAVFLLALVGGVLIFAGIIPIGSSAPTGQTGDVTVWGTARRDAVLPAMEELNRANKTYRIIYIEKNPATLDIELTNALARGEGPDLFFMSNDLILRHSDKVFVTPFTAIPEKTFRDTYISEADLYITPAGILAYPFTVDPMVMYYNRDMLEGAGVVNPPAFWDDFTALAKSITVLGPSKNILKSAVSFGEFSNVNYAKDILSTMLIQKGNPIVTRTATEIRSRLSDSLGGQTIPANDILSFYTDFSNSIKDVYSWNRAMPNSLNAFIAGDLATYFGYASEITSIQAKNPNLNFDVTKLPQTKGSTIRATFGRMNAIAIARTSQNLSTAYTVANQLSGAAMAGKISAVLGLPPARRDLLSVRPTSPYYLSVFYDSALISRAWLDPSALGTDLIFKNIVEDITSGRLNISESVRKGSDSLDLLVRTQ